MNTMAKNKRVRRKTIDYIFTVLCFISLLIGVIALSSIIITLFVKGINAVNFRLFFENLPPLGQVGGLKNAILGSLIITGVAIIFSAPIGILIATYLTEFPSKGKFGAVIRFINDILLSAPSIIIGLFVYSVIVTVTGHFSAMAGMVALGLIAVPMIVRTSEDVMKVIPSNLREAAVALGVSRWKVTMFVIYRAAKSGLITGVILALARIAGETAPLLFTVLNNQFPSSDIFKPMANLPVVMFQYALSPYKNSQELAWAAALIITVTILTLNILTRLVFSRKRKIN
ncbi:MAG TPA: phosphate ABC transporter permease PstA [Victivallales bacterium]|nr:phosphate ABC transporter permease PstA [Victivallales bacterium]